MLARQMDRIRHFHDSYELIQQQRMTQQISMCKTIGKKKKTITFRSWNYIKSILAIHDVHSSSVIRFGNAIKDRYLTRTEKQIMSQRTVSTPDTN